MTRRHSPQSAPNIIKGNHCQACDKDVCFEKEVIQCRLCKDYLHAINCEGFTEHWVSSKTSFSSHILPALNNKRNSGTGRKRPGAVWYNCDCCETDIEKSDAVNEIDKVVILEQKIDSVQTNLRDEISELKNLIINLNNKSADDFSVNTNAQLEPSLTKNDNVWMDSQRTERLKHLIAVQKTDSGVKVDDGLDTNNTHLAMHSDDESSILADSKIMTLSIGATRGVVFESKHSSNKLREELQVSNNSVYIMSRRSQNWFRHGVPPPPQGDVTDERFSITFRCLKKQFSRSILLIGDSNTKEVNFGSGSGKVGQSFPGKRIRAAKVKDIDPQECTGYSNIFIMCGTNDLRSGMSNMKPEVLRKMVTESRSLSPPLISRDKSSVSEMDILYNRIDQQVELISVLKQRLDEMTKRWERSEAELEQQELERSKVQQSHNQIAIKYSNLEVRWRQLTENHKEMITLKDDYKEKCRSITDRLKKLEVGESAALAVEQRKYNDLQKTVAELQTSQKKHLSHQNSMQEKIKSLESQVENLLEKEKKLLEELQQDQLNHKVSVSQFELKLEDNDSLLAQSKNQNEKLKDQISDLTQQIINRGKIVQDKDEQVKRLQSEKKKSDETNKKLAKELADLTESVNGNRIVKDLREKLVDEKERYRRLEIELERFKTAAKEQLMKEQSVNKQLRHVSLDRERNMNSL
ncbi:hypothetical protein ACHWQZ_G001137 [Mnemiopsis leidyi]